MFLTKPTLSLSAQLFHNIILLIVLFCKTNKKISKKIMLQALIIGDFLETEKESSENPEKSLHKI